MSDDRLNELSKQLSKQLLTFHRDFYRRNFLSAFPEYEKLVGRTEPDDDFRDALSTAVGRYMLSLEFQATQVENERSWRLAELEHAKSREAEARKSYEEMKGYYERSVDRKGTHDFKFKAFFEWHYWKEQLERVQQEQGRRGRRHQNADQNFIYEMAEVYRRATGREPTISTSDKYSGQFVALIESVQRDLRDTLRNRMPQIVNAMSTNLGRKAKSLKLTKKDLMT